VRPLTLLAALLALALVAACGDSTPRVADYDPPATGAGAVGAVTTVAEASAPSIDELVEDDGPPPLADIRAAVPPDDGSFVIVNWDDEFDVGDVQWWQLRCDPPGGDAADPAALCGALGPLVGRFDGGARVSCPDIAFDDAGEIQRRVIYGRIGGLDRAIDLRIGDDCPEPRWAAFDAVWTSLDG
jgi:hypothetical protein